MITSYINYIIKRFVHAFPFSYVTSGFRNAPQCAILQSGDIVGCRVPLLRCGMIVSARPEVQFLLRFSLGHFCFWCVDSPLVQFRALSVWSSQVPGTSCFVLSGLLGCFCLCSDFALKNICFAFVVPSHGLGYIFAVA